ncbi:hypothetical protein EYR38_009767 [Pleurotus pulmonarius]|nr:hypothetical protein EYR38_009767 [Pleurotus pulmonarius]
MTKSNRPSARAGVQDPPYTPVIITMGRDHHKRSSISGSETERESEQYETSRRTESWTTRTNRNGEDLKGKVREESTKHSKYVSDSQREDRSSRRNDGHDTRSEDLERPSQSSKPSRGTKDPRRQEQGVTSIAVRHPLRGATTEDGYPTPPITIQSSSTRHRSHSSRSREPESILGYPSPPPTIAPRSSRNSATPTRYPDSSYSHRYQSRAADDSRSQRSQKGAASNSYSRQNQTFQGPLNDASYIVVGPPRDSQDTSYVIVRSPQESGGQPNVPNQYNADSYWSPQQAPNLHPRDAAPEWPGRSQYTHWQPQQPLIIQSDTAPHETPVILYDHDPYEAPFIPPYPYGDVEEDRSGSVRKRQQPLMKGLINAFNTATGRNSTTRRRNDTR